MLHRYVVGEKRLASHRVAALSAGLGIALLVAAGACADDSANGLLSRGGPGGVGSEDRGPADGGPGVNNSGPPAEELLFRAVEGDLEQQCGKKCHTDGTYKPLPPTFLAGPDAYKSVKAQPGAIVADYYQSVLLQKGPHAGPAISVDPTFEAKVIAWLKMEAAVIQAMKRPTTDSTSLVLGPNDLDLSKACVGGLTGVHLTFDAALTGGVLSLTKLMIAAPAGTDVHVYKPSFIRVLSKRDSANRKEISDSAESFSNTDQTVPGGAITVLSPGSAFFTAAGWVPFDFASDKVRIEFAKLEPGKVPVLEKPKICKDVAGFTAKVLPSMKGGGGISPDCASCHGAGLAGLSLNNANQSLVCTQILQNLNETDLGKSLLVTKVTAGPHTGGLVNNAANWTNLFIANKSVFF